MGEDEEEAEEEDEEAERRNRRENGTVKECERTPQDSYRSSLDDSSRTTTVFSYFSFQGF